MRRGTFFWGGILVLIGIVLLLDNLNIFGNINVWNLIWPFFLILLGAWILWGTVFRRSIETEHATISLGSAKKARVRIQHGAGRMDLFSGVESGLLVEGDFGGGLQSTARQEGDTLRVNMRVPERYFPFFWTPGESMDWSFGLAKNVPLHLEVEGGANEAKLDLSELRVEELTVKSGASSTKVTLPANAGHTRVRISSGVASVEVKVPQDVAARIHAGGGLAEIKVDSHRFPRNGEVYETPDYVDALNKVDIDVDMGVGSVRVY